MSPCYRFSVNGRVQGVFFRQSTRQLALQLGLRGWVRNCDDGRVEGLATGEADALLRLQQWLDRGPAAAVVEAVQWQPCEPPDARELTSFEVRR